MKIAIAKKVLRSSIAPLGLLVILAGSLSLLLGRNSPAAVLTGDYQWVHDPSRVIKCNGKYFVYYTGNNIPALTSTDLLNWKKSKSVFDRVPDWVRKAVPDAKSEFVWAPDVIFLNDRYYLYYSFSTFGSKVSVTGLLTSPTLDPDNPNYKWTDQGLVLASNQSSDFNAIDPAPLLDGQGNLWLTLGSWNRGGIKLVRVDNQTGKPIATPNTVAAGQGTGPEAPYLHYRDGYYYLFENEGLCCKGMNSTYRIMMGRSKNIAGPYLDKEGKDLSRGGGTEFMASEGVEVGPGHVGILQEDGIDRLTFHYYNSQTNGIPTLGMRTLVWGQDGWPQAAPELPAGRYAIISEASGLALGSYNNGYENSTPIDQFTYLGGLTQQWNVSPVGDSYYSIGSMGTGKFFDLFECSSKDGTKITQYEWFGNDCQKWRIEPVGKGVYRVISKGGGTVLTLPENSKAPQAQVQGFRWKGEAGQRWIFKKVP